MLFFVRLQIYKKKKKSKIHFDTVVKLFHIRVKLQALMAAFSHTNKYYTLSSTGPKNH